MLMTMITVTGLRIVARDLMLLVLLLLGDRATVSLARLRRACSTLFRAAIFVLNTRHCCRKACSSKSCQFMYSTFAFGSRTCQCLLVRASAQSNSVPNMSSVVQ
jgi:hypothetical protein